MEKIVVGNLKMNLTELDVEKYLEIINKEDFNDIKLFIAPSYIYLEKFKSDKYNLTAQNVSLFYDGAYTGEISASQLNSIGVKSVIIGHSERRNLFNEDSNIINEKIKKSLSNNLNVILCVGENEKEDIDIVKKNIINELKEDLKDISDVENIIVAYEPVYAISSDNSADLEDIKNVVDGIKNYLFATYNKNINVIYGGSVNENNIEDIVDICDGVIVGKMSLNAENFVNLINKIK